MKSCSLLLLTSLLALPCALRAEEAGADQHPFKLTLGEYRYTDGYGGQDVNLRWRRDATNAWIGAYRDPVFGTQTRTGFDTSFAVGGTATVQPSLQIASGGFVGASVNFQIGDPWYALLGWSRTNLRPYFNLNFDPNEAITAGVGWRGENGRNVSLTLVADDRLHTGQRDWHLATRWPLSSDTHVVLDLLRKTGEGDSGSVQAWGWSATLDYNAWFVRLAHDPKQNFSTQDATRFVVGARF